MCGPVTAPIRKRSAKSPWKGRLLRMLLGTAAALLLVWGLLPLVTWGIHNAGVVVLIGAGAAGVAACLFSRAVCRLFGRLWSKKGGRILLIFVGGTAAALLLAFIVVSCLMLHAAARKPPQGATVIVLGAQVRGDQPSLMLADRLHAAAHYLEANPSSRCIVSGGQGADEAHSEAAVMQRYLVSLGIAEERIYMEAASTNTYENIRFSRDIIEREGLSRTVVIATQEFHQYRAQSFARRAGLTETGPCTCRSPFHLLGCYWVREFAAVCRMTLLGY